MQNIRIGLMALLASVCVVSMALAGTVVGWRTNGLSDYPTAQPTTQWSARQNVVWSTPLPNWGNATPVVLSDRIIVCAEPTDLVCLSKADGKIMWTASNAYADIMSPDEKDQAAKDKAAADKIQKEEVGPLQKDRDAAQKQLNSLLPPKPQKGSTQPATAPTAEQTSAIDAAKKDLAAADAKLKAAKAKLAPFNKMSMGSATNGGNGQSSASPVSDGSVVGVVFNTGVAAVYDLDGHRKWARFVETQGMGGNGSSTSPLIFGDTLLVHFQNLKALDLTTGKEIWSAAGTRCSYGTPTLARIGNVDVAITAGGDVVDLSNGKVLLKQLCPLQYNSPIFVDSVAYFIQNTDGRIGKAVKITAGADGQLEAKPLWTTKPRSERYYSSPLLHDGLIYAINENRHLSVIDAATGEVVTDKDLDLGKSTVYPSIVFGGNYIFVSGDSGQTLVIEPGKDLKEAGQNTLERFRSTPVFEGARMYIRGYKAMWCIGK